MIAVLSFRDILLQERARIDTLLEKWSDAARAASAAARKARAKGKDWRKEGQAAYTAAGGKGGATAGERVRRSEVAGLAKNEFRDYGIKRTQQPDYKKAVAAHTARKEKRKLYTAPGTNEERIRRKTAAGQRAARTGPGFKVKLVRAR